MATIINSDTQFTDEATGELLVNGFIYIGLDGQDAKLNAKAIYSDRDLTVSLANPQRTGADGRSVNKIWVDGKYSMKVENFENVQKYNELSLGELTQTGNTILTNVQGTDALTADASPTITALVDRQVYILTAASANTTAVTLTIDSTPTWPIKKQHDKALVAGDIEANQVLALIFNSTDSTFELMTNSALEPVDVATNQTIAGNKTFTGTIAVNTQSAGDNSTKAASTAYADAIIPSGALMLFQQTSAPTGWTKQTTHDDKALRVVSGAAGSGGTKAFTTTFGSGKTSDSHTLTSAESGLPAHVHPLKGSINGIGSYAQGAPYANLSAGNLGPRDVDANTAADASTGHTHNLTNFDLQYVDLIIASKD